MDKAFLQVFSNVVREQTSNRHEVNVEGIGVFKSTHTNQYQQKYKDGRVVLMPPKDTIAFVPDSRWTNG